MIEYVITHLEPVITIACGVVLGALIFSLIIWILLHFAHKTSEVDLERVLRGKEGFRR